MTINTTNLTGVDTLQELALFTNNETGQILFIGGIITLYIVTLLVLSRTEYDFVNVLATSSWAFVLISGLMWFSKLLPATIPLLFVFIAGFSVFYMYASK